MRWLLVLAISACAVAAEDAAEVCHDELASNHRAVNPTTGECWDFGSSCDVPPSWDACPPTMDGVPMRACITDEECPRDQRCDLGGCVDNAPCISDADCAAPLECGPPQSDEACDPSDPDCTAVVPTSLCTRPAMPCVLAEECAPEDLCPIAYLADAPPTCATACADDSVCPEGTVCNADEVCAQEPGETVCHGWCTPVP